MEFHSWKGLIVVLLIHHCKPQDLSTSTLLSTSETTQETETSPLDPELSPGEVVPEVAPPSLKEVEDAVQEASEMGEERGAEEVLKELLERVVEAALGETAKGGGGEEVGVAVAVEEVGVAVEEVEAEAGLEAEVVGEEAGLTGGEVVAEEAAGLGEEVDDGEVDATKADGEETLVEKVEVTEEGAEGEAAAGVGEEAVVEEGGAGEGEEIIEEPAVEPKVLEEAGATPEKGEEEVEETAVEAEVMIEEVGQETEGATAAGEQVDQETVTYLDSAPGVEEQPGGEEGEGAVEEAEAQGGAGEGGEEVAEQPLDNYEEMETTQSVVGEPVDEEEGGEEAGEEVAEVVVVGAGEVEEEGATEEGGEGEGVAVAAGEEGEGEAGVAAEGGGEDGESVGEVVEEAGAAEGGGEDGENVGEEEAAGAAGHLLEEAREETEVAVETLVTTDPEQPEVVPDLGEPEDLPVTLTSSLSGEETNAMGGDDLVGEESNHNNEIFTSKDNLNLEPVKAAPTLDNSVEEIPATPPQPEEDEELGEPNVIGETSTAVSEGGLGLEAWKIGAISAAVFLVLETIVIVVYVLKCRNKSNSAPAPERACEEACVEAEPATAVCEDDTLLAGHGDTQQIAALDPSDLSQVVTQQDVEEEEEEEEDIQLSSIEQCVEPSHPASEQDLRTSEL